MDVIRDFRRGAVRLHVLHHAAEREVIGAWMATELAEHGYPISPGTLYPLLHDLEEAGLLTSQERVDDGHAVRCYSATDQGRATLADARTAIRELAAELLPAGEPAGWQPRRASGSRGGRSAKPLTVELNELIGRVRPAGGRRSDPRHQAVADILSGVRNLLAEEK